MQSARNVTATLLLCSLAACTGVIPVSVLDGGDEVMRGTVEPNFTMTNTHFTVAGKALSCSATFNWQDKPTTSFPIVCSDGQKGRAMISRSASLSVSILAGSGSISLEDGTRYDFLYGPGI